MYGLIQIVALQATFLLSLIPQVADAQTVLATQCWVKKNDTIKKSPGGPCSVVTPDSNFTTCCGIGHICLANGLCKSPNINPTGPANATGYYIGGCTDQSYEAPACIDTCSEFVNLDIVYNSSSTEWSCCGAFANGDPRCTRPTKKTFEDAAPRDLASTYLVLETVSTAAPTGTSVPTGSYTTVPNEGPTESGTSPEGPETDTSGLSTGAKAGIGVGVAGGALAVLGLLGFFFMRRRKHPSKGMDGAYTGTETDGRRADKKPGYVEGVNDGKVMEKYSVPVPAPKPQEKFSERQGEEVLGNGSRDGEVRHELSGS